ncbi:MAG TPA: TIGR03435 family protein [Acidobacteriaceae bacterium]|nr:TIGR03435 family protein [Acidobacteriaceae bacterium]
MGNAGQRTKSLLFAAAWITMLAPVGFAQLPATPGQETSAPVFEVATIKPSNPETRGSGFWINDDGIDSTNMPLTVLLQFAYNLSTGSVDQIIGGPMWMGSAKFDIKTKEDAQLARKISKLPREEQLATERQMVEALLADRFQLKVHHEARDLRVVALTVAKGGPKLTETKADSNKGSWTGLRSSRGKIEGRGATIKMLVGSLSPKPEIGGRLVVDDTGLTGKYDFELTWSPEDLAHTESDAGGPSLFTALQEQLGLKVETKKSPVDCIIVDHVEMPSKD